MTRVISHTSLQLLSYCTFISILTVKSFILMMLHAVCRSSIFLLPCVVLSIRNIKHFSSTMKVKSMAVDHFPLSGSYSVSGTVHVYGNIQCFFHVSGCFELCLEVWFRAVVFPSVRRKDLQTMRLQTFLLGWGGRSTILGISGSDSVLLG